MDSIESNTSTDDDADDDTDIYDYEAILNEWFPYYLSIGMTYEQYWDGDPYLTVHYRKARELQFDYDNQMAWIQGMYIYDAVSAIVFNAWCRKDGESPNTYANKPYEFDEKKRKEDLIKEAEVQAEAWMINFVNFYRA